MGDVANGCAACYYCGYSLSAYSTGGGSSADRPGRLDECPGCGKYVHVCRMCAWYDPRETSKQCVEDDAEEVRDKQAANFCDYFKLSASAFDPAEQRADSAARSELAELFGDTSATQPSDEPSDEPRLKSDAEALFRK